MAERSHNTLVKTTIIAIGWTRGNKKGLATILGLRELPKFDYYDIATAHRITKRDVGIAYATKKNSL
jgi:hypothetical protein